jgi:hypothetical protein
MEPEDGATIQVMYVADNPVKFKVNGTIEGVKSFNGASENPLSNLRIALNISKTIAGILAFIGAIMLSAAVYGRISKKFPIFFKYFGKVVSAVFVAAVFGVLAYVAVAILYGIYDDAKKAAINSVPAALQ